MSGSSTVVLPPPGPVSEERIARALAALEKLEKVSGVSAEPPPPPANQPGNLGPGEEDGETPVSVAADLATPAPTTSPGAEDPPEVALARVVMAQQIEQALENVVTHTGAVRAVLKAEGVSIGISDTGQPVISKNGGEELPITPANLVVLGVMDSLIRSQGKPGTGLVGGGGTWTPPSLEDGLGSQQSWDANRAAMLREYARRKGIKS